MKIGSCSAAILFLLISLSCAAPPDASPQTPPGSASVRVTVEVVGYEGDAMHSTVINDEGVILHPEWFDRALCRIVHPPEMAGEDLQIWGWNLQGGPLDERLRTPGSRVAFRCRPAARTPPPWGSGPAGFGQWEIEFEPSAGPQE